MPFCVFGKREERQGAACLRRGEAADVAEDHRVAAQPEELVGRELVDVGDDGAQGAGVGIEVDVRDGAEPVARLLDRGLADRVEVGIAAPLFGRPGGGAHRVGVGDGDGIGPERTELVPGQDRAGPLPLDAQSGDARRLGLDQEPFDVADGLRRGRVHDRPVASFSDAHCLSQGRRDARRTPRRRP